MKVGDMVKWTWYLGTSTWDKTEMEGLIIDARVTKTEHEAVHILDVLLTDGSVCEVRKDKDDLECVA